MGFTIARGEESAPRPLWLESPANFVEVAPPETTDKSGNISNVSISAVTVHLPPKEKSTGMALIICPGGSYRMLGWATHVAASAEYFNARGIAVIGLKYRTNPPNKISPEDRSVPLADLQRAVRTARFHAAEWNIDPGQIGVLGFSAGANLAVTSAEKFDDGDSGSEDPIERLSCRPDYVVACSAWHWKQKTSPFTFPKNAPPVFLVHATDDATAPVELPHAIKSQLESLGAPVHLEIYGEGGHSVAHLIPRWIEQGIPASKWPDRLMEWLKSLGLHSSPAQP